jgi:glycosyltransferase involved in cell wall biosynthesis
MRILMLAPPPEAVGPIPGIARELALALGTCGHEVTVMSWGASSGRENPLARALRAAQDIRNVTRALHGRSADVLYAHTGHDWRTLLRDLPLTFLVRRQVRAIALQLHGSQSQLLNAPHRAVFTWASRALVAMASVVFVLSRQERREWEGLNVDTPFVTVVNPFVSPAAMSREAVAGERALRVIFVGRLLREKGVLETVDAFTRVCEDYPVTLEILGDGPVLPNVESMVRDSPSLCAVALRGSVSRPEAMEAMARSDVLVLPTSWNEGFPTVLAEAMSVGLALVTTRIRGAADLLEEGVHAIFVPARSPEAIAAALRHLADNPALLGRMAEANRKRVLDFLPEKVVGTYESALEAAVQRRDGLA